MSRPYLYSLCKSWFGGSVRCSSMFRTRQIKRRKSDPPGNMERMEVVTLLKVPVKVLCYGDVTPSVIVKNPEAKPKKLVLVIPGNPGVAEFYSEFGARLHEKSKLPVWIVAHGGHEDLPVPRLTSHPNLYSLQGQVQQKRELIDSYLSGVTLRCIGHSIGSKMMIDLLKSDEKYSKQIEKVELLFPTIENMAATVAGQKLVFCLNYLYWPVLWFVVIFHMLPDILKALVLRIFAVYAWDAPPSCVPALVKLLEPRLVRKALDLGDEEMRTVLKRDDETIKKYSDILHFYYGASDLWTPISYCEDLKQSVPGVNAEIDQLGIPHTFGLNHGRTVADLVVNWWNKDQKKRIIP